LYDKVAKRELLYKNETIHFGNLSLRNAWFCGGVEWNVSIKGHNPLTCSPIFAAVLEKDGESGLRLYEFERKREIVYSLDVWLPNGAEFLLVHTRIENTDIKEKYTYWWSNIAVPQTEGLRIAVPAETAYVSTYRQDGYFLDFCEMPRYQGTDITIPEKSSQSYDFFYRTEERQKYIAAINPDGYGLLETSTDELQGRKLFVWGQGNGGKNWNEFLTKKGDAYAEIQAGLAETQLEHLIIPPSCTWEWTEAFSSVQLERLPESYKDFCGETEEEIRKKYPRGISAELKRAYSRYKDAKFVRVVCNGSGWGALKELERSRAKQSPLSRFCIFPSETLSEKQKPFINLLENGVFPEVSPDCPPKAYCVTEAIRNTMRLSVNIAPNWTALYHFGVMLYAAGETESARNAWEESLKLRENAWAYRNLAMLYRNEYGDKKRAAELMEKAVSLKRDCKALWIDFAETLLGAGEYSEWLERERNIPKGISANSRLQMYKAMCLLRLNEPEKAAEIIDDKFILEDVKEGEFSISALWNEIYGAIIAKKYRLADKTEILLAMEKEYPLRNLDFRMH
jgi:tetratricopeptide TPR_4